MTKQKNYWWQKADPFADREISKYDTPVPSREYLLEYLEEAGKPRKLEHLIESFDLDGDEDREAALDHRLRAMVRDGQIVRNRRNGFLPLSAAELYTGIVMGHRDGFAFVVRDADDGKDIFLGGRQAEQVFDKDRVLVQIVGEDRRGRPEGRIVDVLSRNTEYLVGRYFDEDGVGMVEAVNNRIWQQVLISPQHRNGAEDGQVVEVRITRQPRHRHAAMGEVVEVLGDQMAPGMEVDIAIRAHDLPSEFPDDVLAEAAAYGAEVTEDMFADRLDLRDMPLVTIDGEDSRDFDDAVYAEQRGNGWTLWVAIADVAHYVKPGQPLDEEAELRGTSVYFPNEVIPMLPEALSNGLCSLNPNVNRLCMACEMQIAANGKVKKVKFHNAVMRSHARLTYTTAAEILVEEKPAVRKKHAQLVPHLEDLYGLYKVLRQAREKRGAIDFESSEVKFVYDDSRKIAGVEPVVRNDAHKLIEECMIAANVASAGFLKSKKMPSLYRNHNGPATDSVDDLRSFLNEFSLKLGGGSDPQPKDYARVISKIGDRPERALIQTVLLRSLSRAAYEPDCDGHFGLALEEYGHFTSPIRRYPDLLVHRALKHVLAKQKPKKYIYNHDDMLTFGAHCSMTERRADEATRDAVDWLKCQYLSERVGESFSGVITGVMQFGCFISLDPVGAEGLLHVTSLPSDYYYFDSVSHCLRGERTGRVFRLSDRITVTVASVNLDERKVDLVLADIDTESAQRSDKSSSGKSSGKKVSSEKKPSNKSGTGKKPRSRQSVNKKSTDKKSADNKSVGKRQRNKK